MSDKAFDWDAFNAALQKSTNICNGARKDIDAAIKAGKGKVLLRDGQVWRPYLGSSSLLLIVKIPDSDKFGNFILTSGYSGGLTGTGLEDYLGLEGELVADSLKDYLANGGKL